MSQLLTSMITGRISHSASLGRNYTSRYVEPSGRATFVVFLVTCFEHHLVVKSLNLSSQSCVEMHTFRELELSTCQKKPTIKTRKENAYMCYLGSHIQWFYDNVVLSVV